MRSYSRRPTCHPDRKYQALGLCAPCYMLRWRDPDNAKPHRLYKQVTDVGMYDPDTHIPERISAQQNAVSAPIDTCPKCKSEQIRYVGREARCFTCGHSVWLVRESQAVPLEAG